VVVLRDAEEAVVALREEAAAVAGEVAEEEELHSKWLSLIVGAFRRFGLSTLLSRPSTPSPFRRAYSNRQYSSQYYSSD
jgi:hypothetical protein